MRLLISAILTCLVISVNVVHAKNLETDYEKTALMLFPETSDWTPVSKMRKADTGFIIQNWDKLEKAYLSSKVSNEWESESCSFISRVSVSDGFYLLDINNDGMMDVIYTGWLHCGEGYASLIWFGNKKGYFIKQDSLWQALTVRIKSGNNPVISAVVVGCCASEVDEYCTGPLYNIRNYGYIEVTKNSHFPQRIELPQSFTTNNDIKLRRSPVVIDDYDPSWSEFRNAAVFGNILSTFLPGCNGQVMGSEKDANGSLWYFIVLDKSCGHLRNHSPYTVDAGWVEADKVVLGEQRTKTTTYDEE